jgi:hypothetical protein
MGPKASVNSVPEIEPRLQRPQPIAALTGLFRFFLLRITIKWLERKADYFPNIFLDLPFHILVLLLTFTNSAALK